MCAGQSVCGKPASSLTKADEFLAFWATSRAGMQRAGRLLSLPCCTVTCLALRLLSKRAVSSRQARSFYHFKKGADIFGNIIS